MKITVGPELCIEDYTSLEEKWIIDKCTGTNPDYDNWTRIINAKPNLRYSKKFPKPPELICLHRYLKDKLFVPRGLLTELQRLFNPTIYSLLTNPKPSKPFKLTGIKLRDYQDDAVSKIAPVNFGILEAPTGSGKTLIGLALVQELGLKTLFIVHTKLLLYQTIKEIETKFGITPGIIGDGKFEVKDFTVAMIQTLLKRDMKPYSKSFGIVVIDECLNGNSLIETKRGLKRIDDPSICDEEVLSYDESTDTWQYCKVLRWISKVPKETLLIKTKRGSIRCTRNHKILTMNGWKEAKDLSLTDYIIVPKEYKLKSYLRKILNWLDQKLVKFS